MTQFNALSVEAERVFFLEKFKELALLGMSHTYSNLDAHSCK
jgi:hypothetical protein